MGIKSLSIRKYPLGKREWIMPMGPTVSHMVTFRSCTSDGMLERPAEGVAEAWEKYSSRI
jgi:hypothetical protein